MKILIVGGISSLGQVLKPVLAEFAEVATAGRSGCDLQLDLNDPIEKMAIPAGINVVINTAGSFGSKNFKDMHQAQAINVLGALKLSQACADAHVKHLVMVSSIFAYLGSDSPFYNIYSLSKRHSDEVAQLNCLMNGLPLTILRPSQFYGVGEESRKHQPFLSTIINRAARNEDIELYGSNDAKRNFIHLEDVAQIIARVVKMQIEGMFACMHTKNVSYSEIATAAIEAFHSKSSIRFLADKPDIPDNIFEQNDALYRLIDYYPRISILQGMEKEAAFRKLRG
jgi:nucleoside-diphosphate-sugar epimerase